MKPTEFEERFEESQEKLGRILHSQDQTDAQVRDAKGALKEHERRLEQMDARLRRFEAVRAVGSQPAPWPSVEREPASATRDATLLFLAHALRRSAESARRQEAPMLHVASKLLTSLGPTFGSERPSSRPTSARVAEKPQSQQSPRKRAILIGILSGLLLAIVTIALIGVPVYWASGKIAHLVSAIGTVIVATIALLASLCLRPVSGQ